jgi:hypothetical protein
METSRRILKSSAAQGRREADWRAGCCGGRDAIRPVPAAITPMQLTGSKTLRPDSTEISSGRSYQNQIQPAFGVTWTSLAPTCVPCGDGAPFAPNARDRAELSAIGCSQRPVLREESSQRVFYTVTFRPRPVPSTESVQLLA